jgi:dihydrofolate synthase/folylpolyglutamate synthase
MQGLLRFGEKYGNQRFEELLRLLGDPHRKFPVIHIAGTKGKGSTTSFAASVLRCAGYRTGSYLSPFVYDLRERIQIDGEMISKENFARWVSLIRPHVDHIFSTTDLGQITEFELKTAVAFCYFAEQNVDYAVVEVGLGGRLDATNVVPPPLVSVITNIGFDHVELLGNTLELIAAEKAGIVKTGSVCVTGIEGGPALSKVTEICAKRNVPLHQVQAGRDWAANNDSLMSISTPKRTISGLHLRMRGYFQYANAAAAIHAIDAANIPNVTNEDVRKGLETAYAPGRLEVVSESGPMVILDAAHNELAARVLTDALVKDFRASTRPVVMVIGMSHRHEPQELLQALLTNIHPKLLIATQPSFRPRPAEEIMNAARLLGVEHTEAVIDVPDAANRAIDAARAIDDSLVLITGSFFTIGDLPQAMWNNVPLQAETVS